MRRGFARNLRLAFVSIQHLFFIFVIYIIVWLDRKIGFSLAFPRDVAELAKKQDWCVGVLKQNGVLPAEAQVQEYKVTQLSQEFIFRSNAGIIDITYLQNGEHKTLRCFAKFAPTMGTIWNRTVFNLQLNHIKEAFFNNEFVKVDKEVAAPGVYCALVSPLTGNLCLITEFMSDDIEYKGEDFPVESMPMVLENMAALHARYWQDNSKRMEKVLSIPDAMVDLFDSMVAFNWSTPSRKILVQSWCLMNKYETVLHGDARTGNMMFPSGNGKGRFVFIDWQAVRKGKATFDLAYFLVLSLSAEDRRKHEESALVLYHDHLLAKGVKGYSIEQLREDYRHACLCLLVLLSLPMLSGEASVEGMAALIFSYGMNIWRGRLEAKFKDFDYQWVAKHYDITEQEGCAAATEMLGVIEKRLADINAANMPKVAA